MSEADWVIRPFPGPDLTFPVVELWRRCGLLTPHNDPYADLASQILSHHGRLLVAQEPAGRLIGTVMASHDGHRGWLYKLAVAPEQRRRGLGAALVRAAEAHLADQGIVKAMLLIRDTNQAVRGFYEALGYGAEPRLVMSRWLRPEATTPEPSKVEIVTTHLEMTAPPSHPPPHPPRAGLALLRVDRPSIAFYRYLYEGVGDIWGWQDRTLMSDESLAEIIHDPRVAVSALYAGGEPAGYFDLDGRIPGEVEIAYFGLFPSAIGQRLGPYLLDHAIRAGWRGIRPGDAPITRVWVHTCTLDHPKALPLYQKLGLKPFRRDVDAGTVPPHRLRWRNSAARGAPAA